MLLSAAVGAPAVKDCGAAAASSDISASPAKPTQETSRHDAGWLCVDSRGGDRTPLPAATDCSAVAGAAMVDSNRPTELSRGLIGMPGGNGVWGMTVPLRLSARPLKAKVAPHASRSCDDQPTAAQS